MAKLFNIGGEVFGMWRVIERGPLAKRGEYAKWWCLCICGAFKLVPGKALRCGQSRSCGCTRSYEHNAYPHGDVREFIARFNSYKEKAERRGIAFDLTLDQFADIARRDCAYCGRPPHLPVRRERVRRSTPLMSGVDRVDNARGYFMDNVAACCTTCNEMKLDRSVDHFLAHVRRIAARHA